MNWYIGQEIVAVKSYQPFFKKGDEFTIDGMLNNVCKCGGCVLSIGTPNTNRWPQYCGECGCEEIDLPRSTIWFKSFFFAPKQRTYSEAEIEAVNIDELTKEKVLV